MSLLTAHRLSKYYGPEEVFSEISVEIPQRARIALVGPNGAGKTTLLHLLMRMDDPTEGEVALARGTRIGYLPQRPELEGDATVWEEMLSAFAGLREQEAALMVLEHRMAEAEESAHAALLEEYGELQEAFERGGGYLYEQRIRTVLHGLGFTPDLFARRLMQLSGGQKTRVLLARLLLEAPDLLALDEPTNHLDIAAIEWLEGYLRDFPGAVLAISHDRYFMDSMATTVWELDFASLETYRGNYSAYLQQREERHARLLKEYEAQQEFMAKEEAYIRRNIAGQNVSQAKGRRTRLERLRRDALVSRPRTRRHMSLSIGGTSRSGDLVVRTYDLEVGYPDGPSLFTVPDLVLRRGEAAALIGPNGAGKSTLVKTLIGQLEPHGGRVGLGAGVTVGYFAQAQELLDDQSSLLDEVMKARPMGIAEARNVLGRFLFSGDDAFRKVGSLSGGERGRLALAKLALTGANLLILDEPTNHLDIPSQEILQNVLADYDGTILLVSHDRYLIGALATQVWGLDVSEAETTLTVFDDTYAAYISARDAARQRAIDAERAAREAIKARNAAPPGAARHGLSAFKHQQRLSEVEAQIEAHEQQIELLTAEIGSASAAGDATRVRTLGEAYTQAQADLEVIIEQWALLVE